MFEVFDSMEQFVDEPHVHQPQRGFELLELTSSKKRLFGRHASLVLAIQFDRTLYRSPVCLYKNGQRHSHDS